MRSDALSRELRAAAEEVLAYLSATDALPRASGSAAAPCDAILGFGVFDLKLPRFCGDLHRRGVAPRIIFTGGCGAGTGNLGGPEADVWRETLRRSHPQIPDTAVILENRSSNTGENIRCTAELLAAQHPELAFGRGLRSVVIVASPSRLRRVWLTMRHLAPDSNAVRQLPPVDFDEEYALYASNGVDYLSHLAGELDRLVEYPRRGWIAAEPLPAAIATAGAVLHSAGAFGDRRPPAS